VTDTTFTSQAVAMTNDGVQYVILTAVPTAAAGIIGAAAAIGHPPAGPCRSEYLISLTGAIGGKLTPIAPANGGG
jgi:hypothetical protein